MTTTKPARVCANCARVRVAGKNYVCAVTDRATQPGDTCECYKRAPEDFTVPQSVGAVLCREDDVVTYHCEPWEEA
uniref:Uncharacterized protein n=1 Tax=viral metagenome TaxID=1070528 RepID=A0A6M3LUS1_9ZZZZ